MRITAVLAMLAATAPTFVAGQRPEDGRVCAHEGGTCACVGIVFYGMHSRWRQLRSAGTIGCNNGAFGGDPYPATVKECRCVEATTTEGECRQGNGEYPMKFSRRFPEFRPHTEGSNAAAATARCKQLCSQNSRWCLAAEVVTRWPTPECGLVTDRATFEAAGNTLEQLIDGVSYQTTNNFLGTSWAGGSLYPRAGYHCYHAPFDPTLLSGGDDAQCASGLACFQRSNGEAVETADPAVPSASCSASSEFAFGDNRFHCESAFDSDPESDWATQGEGVGSWIQSNFGAKYSVTRFEYRHRAHNTDNRQITLSFSDGSTQSFVLQDDINSIQSFVVSPVQTSFVRLTVESVYETVHNGARQIIFYGGRVDPVGA